MKNTQGRVLFVTYPTYRSRPTARGRRRRYTRAISPRAARRAVDRTSQTLHRQRNQGRPRDPSWRRDLDISWIKRGSQRGGAHQEKAAEQVNQFKKLADIDIRRNRWSRADEN